MTRGARVSAGNALQPYGPGQQWDKADGATQVTEREEGWGAGGCAQLTAACTSEGGVTCLGRRLLGSARGGGRGKPSKARLHTEERAVELVQQGAGAAGRELASRAGTWCRWLRCKVM